MPESKSGAFPLGYSPIFSALINYSTRNDIFKSKLQIMKLKLGSALVKIVCKIYSYYVTRGGYYGFI